MTSSRPTVKGESVNSLVDGVSFYRSLYDFQAAVYQVYIVNMCV